MTVRRRLLNLRFAGQEEALAVEFREGESLETAFAAAYREVYGYAPEGRAIELESIRVVASSSAEEEPGGVEEPERHDAGASGARRSWFAGEWRNVPVFDRGRLGAGARFQGPALVFEAHSATVVGEDWEGRVDGAGSLILRKRS